MMVEDRTGKKDVVDVDTLMSILVKAPTHRRAYDLARKMGPKALRELGDLLYLEFSPEARTSSMALRVTAEGRGMDREEVVDMCHLSRMPVPGWAKDGC